MMQTTDNIKTQFIRYVALNVLAMMATSCYILADTFFIANGVGADGLTALNVAISLYSFGFSIALMIGIGGGTRFAVCKARDEKKQADQVFTHAVATGLITGLGIAIAGNLFLPEIAAALGAEANILQLTVEYMRVIFSFVPFIILNQVMVAFVRNDGNPKLATAALLISNFSNILLDYIFIYPMDMGMFGAALATALSPVISLSILSLHIVQKKNTFHMIKCGFSMRDTAGFCKLGTSSMVNELSVGLVVMIFNLLFFNLGGNTAVAAYGVVANCAIVGTAIFTGIAQGIQPLVSHAYGRGAAAEQKKILQYATLTAIGLAIILVTAVLVLDHQIASVFNKENDPLLQTIAVEGLRIYFVSYFAACFNIVFAGYLSAMERADYGFVISLMRGLVVIAPMALVLSGFFGMTGIWIAVPAAETVTLMVSLWMVWKTIKG